ncbi:ThuA domain-containing protein [Cohnella candidum]|uniref:ThuA domain-containing protein n=1 Tax=Cohnella candidum TaxID=2674991 RepID=UPI001F14A1FD|nr:ThuA domain-containing protein [Cohnella candidum]
MLDEHYFVEYDSARTETFLRSESVDGSSVAGWRHTFGAGRVCCLTPAHRREGLLQPDFQRLLGEAVRWCCG